MRLMNIDHYCKWRKAGDRFQGWEKTYAVTDFHVNWDSWEDPRTRIEYYIENIDRLYFYFCSLKCVFLKNSLPHIAQQNHQQNISEVHFTSTTWPLHFYFASYTYHWWWKVKDTCYLKFRKRGHNKLENKQYSRNSLIQTCLVLSVLEWLKCLDNWTMTKSVFIVVMQVTTTAAHTQFTSHGLLL